MSVRLTWFLPLLTFLLIMGTSCGNGNSSYGRGQMKETAYEQGSEERRSPDQDVRFDTSAAGSEWSAHSAYPPYSADINLLKDGVRKIPGVRQSTIVLNGPTAYITLHLQDEVDLEESMRIRNQAQASLQRLMPRYNVRVSVGKGNILPPVGS